MKKFTFTSLLATVVIAATFAQPALQWDKRFNGPAANDKGNSIALDASGNVYVTGSSDGIGTGSDYLTIKYNSNGDTLWTKRYNGSANGTDIASAIKVDAAGNVYVTGKRQGNGSAYDLVTIKYNTNGVQQWIAVASGPGEAAAYNLAVDFSGNVYVAGRISSIGQTIKYNSSGVFQWSQSIGFQGDLNNKVLIAINPNDGNIIVANGTCLQCEYYIQALNHVNGSVIQVYNSHPNNFKIGFPDALVLDGVGDIYVTSTSTSQTSSEPRTVTTTKFRYPGQSNESWTWWFSSFATGNGTMSGVDTKIDANLNVYVLSNFNTGSNDRYHIKKYRPTDQMIWTATYNAAGGINDTPISLAINNLSNPEIFVTGYTGTGNITTVKYDNNVNQLWQVVYDCGNNGIDLASAMVMDNCDNIYITGHSNCNNTNQDVKTLKYAALTSTITPDGPTTFCQGGSVMLTASTANSYLWSNGETTQSITASAPGNYSVSITNVNGCTAASQSVPVTVNPLLPTSVSIVGPTTICSGENATFIPTSTNGGSAPVYQWFVNDVLVETGATYSTTLLTNGAQVRCAMTSNATCASPAMANSNTIFITVNPALTASVSVVGPLAICSGENVTFTASPTNGGTVPSYQWFMNNIPVGTGPTYSTTTLTNGAQVRCTMTSNATCVSSPTATSNTISVAVNPQLTPGLSISGPPVICSGQNATFTATPSNGGAIPAYQWFVNNNPVGTGPTYSTSTLANGDQIHCTMISNAVCVSPATATSPATTVTVLALPNVQITPSGPTTFCQENSVTLTANPTGSYLWSTGATDKIITVSTAGDYTVHVTAINGCSAVSTPTSVMVNPLPLTPVVFPSGPIMVQEGDSIILTASFANSWLWNTGDTTQSITVFVVGNYWVVVTDLNGCSAASDSTSIVVGASEATLPEAFNISPNPSSGTFTVEFFLPEAKTVAQRVLNVLGQTVWVAAPGLETGEFRREIDLGMAVMPGIYLLETRLDGGAFLRKIVVR